MCATPMDSQDTALAPLRFPTYRDFLRHRLAEARLRRATYTQGAFARRLGFAPHRFGEVLRGREGMSRRVAARVGRSLGLTKTDLEDFCDLVSAEHERAEVQRLAARARLLARRNPVEHQAMSAEEFSDIAAWQHFALLELLESGPRTSASLADALGLPVLLVTTSLLRLQKRKLVVRHWIKGQPSLWKKTGKPLEVLGGMPSAHVRRFHRQLLEKAMQSLEGVPPERREFVTLLVRARAEDLEEVRGRIRRFWSELETELEKRQGEKHLHALAVQYFPLES